MCPFLCVLQEVRFTLDRCSGATIMEMEGVGSWLTTEDHSSCEVTGSTPNTDRYTLVFSVCKPMNESVLSLFFSAALYLHDAKGPQNLNVTEHISYYTL